jgi:hypothetical protein
MRTSRKGSILLRNPLGRGECAKAHSLFFGCKQSEQLQASLYKENNQLLLKAYVSYNILKNNENFCTLMYLM